MAVYGKEDRVSKHPKYLRRGILCAVLLSSCLDGCGNQSTPTDVINVWASAATADDWSRARELMSADERTFSAWRTLHDSIRADFLPPHQILNSIVTGDTTSAVVRWPARTGGWCAPVYVDAAGKLTLARPDMYYACDAQAQPLTAPAKGETQARTVTKETSLFANPIEIDPIATVQAGEQVVVMLEDYNRNRRWFKVRPAPGSAATWTEGWIFADAAGGQP